MRPYPILALLVVPLAVVAFAPADSQPAADRLMRHLYTRTSQDGKVYAPESLEPLLFQSSRFLTDGDSHRQAIALLDEFLKAHADKPITDPLRRAMLQRDLWAVFAATTGTARRLIFEEPAGHRWWTERFFDPGDANLERIPQRRGLQRRLARAMRAVALTADEIKALPDNLDAAVRSRAFPAEFDPRRPERTFLPPDLLSADGPWLPIVNSVREDRLAAPQHLAFSRGRSVFVSLLRLPKGRAATLAYIQELDAAARKGKELPTLPDNAQTGLVRRMLLIDRAGRLHESRLTESVELRIPHPNDGGRGFAFHLHRADRFAGRHGGLHAVGPEEVTHFDLQGVRSEPSEAADPFEVKKPDPPLRMMDTCVGCHRFQDGDGVQGIITMRRSRMDRKGLRTTTVKEQVSASGEWLRGTYTWGLLQGMWE